MSQPVMVFCAAASQDTHLLTQWEKHLLPLQQAGYITIWSEQRIVAGTNRNEHIARHLEQAQIIVLLLSSDFFASTECCTLMTQAIQRSHNDQVRVIPLLLRSVAWRETPLGVLSCLPSNGRPITRWGDRDEAFQDCVIGIRKLLDQPAAATSTNDQSQSAEPVLQDQTVSAPYHSCFLSYSSQDEALAQRLHDDLQKQGVRCWFAPEDLRIGDKFRTSIDEAIHVHEKLLLILSRHSVESSWVESEVETAFEKETQEKRLVLFPIRIDESVLTTREAWAANLRRMRHIGDFTRWTEPSAYQQAFERLLRDLKKTD